MLREWMVSNAPAAWETRTEGIRVSTDMVCFCLTTGWLKLLLRTGMIGAGGWDVPMLGYEFMLCRREGRPSSPGGGMNWRDMVLLFRARLDKSSERSRSDSSKNFGPSRSSAFVLTLFPRLREGVG